MATTGQLFTVMKEFCTAKGYKVALEDKHGGVMVLLVSQDSGVTVVMLKTDDAKDEIVIECCYMEEIAVEFKETLIMYCVRANYGLNIGGFNFDEDKNRFSFQVAQDMEGLSKEEIKKILDQMFSISLQTFERYAVGVRYIVQKKLDDKAAIALVEGS